jgi:squalene cyclase
VPRIRPCGAPWSIGWQQRQNADGGWGESNDSYLDPDLAGAAREHPYQTAWALLALLAAGDARIDAVRRAAEFLLRTQQSGWPVERSELHRAGISARVLSQVPRLLRLLPALGAGRPGRRAS